MGRCAFAARKLTFSAPTLVPIRIRGRSPRSSAGAAEPTARRLRRRHARRHPPVPARPDHVVRDRSPAGAYPQPPQPRTCAAADGALEVAAPRYRFPYKGITGRPTSLRSSPRGSDRQHGRGPTPELERDRVIAFVSRGHNSSATASRRDRAVTPRVTRSGLRASARDR